MKIAILGSGKMGSWIASELSKENKVAVFDKDPKKTNKSAGCDILAKIEDIEDFKPEILINAVNIENTINAFKSIEKIIDSGCIICDMASIKGKLPEYYGNCGFKYASFHPMFGYTFSSVGDLKEESAVIIRESNETARQFFKNFFDNLGIRVFEYSFTEHDEMMVYSLLLPLISSTVFATCAPDRVVPGSTFLKDKKIALGLLSEDNHLLSEILFNAQSLEQVEKVTGRLEFLKHIIKARGYEEADAFFSKLRDNLV